MFQANDSFLLWNEKRLTTAFGTIFMPLLTEQFRTLRILRKTITLERNSKMNKYCPTVLVSQIHSSRQGGVRYILRPEVEAYGIAHQRYVVDCPVHGV